MFLISKFLHFLPVANRDGFGPGPAQPKSARAYIPTWPKVGPGPKVAQRKLAQIGLGPIFFGPGPAQKTVGPDKWPKTAQNNKIWPKFSTFQTYKNGKILEFDTFQKVLSSKSNRRIAYV